MNILSYIVVSVLFLCLIYMYVTVFRKGTKVSFREWAMTTALLILIWGAVLIIETLWWFWPQLPGGTITHQIVMGLGGLFGIYWGALYIFVLRRKN